MKKITIKTVDKDMLLEFFFGFMMAVAAFHILPLSYEISGIWIAVGGSVCGVLIFFLLKLLFGKYRYLWIVVNLFVGLMFLAFQLPFYSCFGNGFYLGILSGVLLSTQILYLSEEPKIKVLKKAMDLWYIAGLLLGILLK